MKRRILLTSILAAAAVTAGGVYLYLQKSMDAGEVLRKLGGMRVAIELYRQEHGKLPGAFEDTLKAGTLEESFKLKLKGRPVQRRVRNMPELRIMDTGGWAYVNAPESADFGLLYIDSAGKDEKGRFWSEF